MAARATSVAACTVAAAPPPCAYAAAAAAATAAAAAAAAAAARSRPPSRCWCSFVPYVYPAAPHTPPRQVVPCPRQGGARQQRIAHRSGAPRRRRCRLMRGAAPAYLRPSCISARRRSLRRQAATAATLLRPILSPRRPPQLDSLKSEMRALEKAMQVPIHLRPQHARCSATASTSPSPAQT